MNFNKFFNLSGMLVFLIVAVVNLYMLIHTWSIMPTANKITSSVFDFFYFLISIMFYKMYKMYSSVPEVNEDELDKIVGGINGKM